jgi:transcription elongation GreA/GreB family factor
MSKRKLFVVNVPATACYKVFATNEIEAKQILLEEAGYSIKAEILFLEDELRRAEVIEVNPEKKVKVA